MKQLLLIFSLFVASLMSVKVAVNTFLPTSWKECVQLCCDKRTTDINDCSCFFSSGYEHSFGDMIWAGTRQLTRHFSGNSNRSVRTATHYYILFNKALMRLMYARMESMNQAFSQFSTMPSLSWSVSSDHYIFGMRRILI